MRVNVERDAGGFDVRKPTRFHLDGRHIEVIENLDRCLVETMPTTRSGVTMAIFTFFV
jgi:hypothetical protein